MDIKEFAIVLTGREYGKEITKEEEKLAKEKARVIEAIWGKEYCWEYKTNITHAEFEIFEGNDKYCKGIVFDIRDLD